MQLGPESAFNKPTAGAVYSLSISDAVSPVRYVRTLTLPQNAPDHWYQEGGIVALPPRPGILGSMQNRNVLAIIGDDTNLAFQVQQDRLYLLQDP